MSRKHQDELIKGFDYRQDREHGGRGESVEWPRHTWAGIITAITAHGGSVERIRERDGTHTTNIREKINGRLDGSLEAYNL